MEGDFMKNMLLFQVGTSPYAIDLSCVRNIQSVKHIADEGTKGSISLSQPLDDKSIALYDLISFFEIDTVERNFKKEKMIMVEAEGLPIGLIVSRVDNVISVERKRLQSLSPIFRRVSASCFPKVLIYEDTLILLLAPEGIKKVLQPKAISKLIPSTNNAHLLNTLSGEIDTTDIDDDLQYESASFLTNLLQVDRKF